MSKKRDSVSAEVNKNDAVSDNTVTDKEDMEAYRKVRWIDKIPYWVKALIIRYWTCGVIFFFVNMGLGNLLFGETLGEWSDFYVLVLIGGILYGVAYYFLAGFLMDICETVDGEGRMFTIFYSRKIYALWIDIVYGLVWAFVSYFLSAYFVTLLKVNTSLYWMFREPLTFAFIGLAVEALFVGLKDLVVFSYKKLTHKESM